MQAIEACDKLWHSCVALPAGSAAASPLLLRFWPGFVLETRDPMIFAGSLTVRSDDEIDPKMLQF